MCECLQVLPGIGDAVNMIPQREENSNWFYVQIGYIQDAGYLNLDRFEKFLEALSKVEYEEFEDHFADMKWFQSKREVRLKSLMYLSQLKLLFF